MVSQLPACHVRSSGTEVRGAPSTMDERVVTYSPPAAVVKHLKPAKLCTAISRNRTVCKSHAAVLCNRQTRMLCSWQSAILPANMSGSADSQHRGNAIDVLSTHESLQRHALSLEDQPQELTRCVKALLTLRHRNPIMKLKL